MLYLKILLCGLVTSLAGTTAKAIALKDCTRFSCKDTAVYKECKEEFPDKIPNCEAAWDATITQKIRQQEDLQRQAEREKIKLQNSLKAINAKIKELKIEVKNLNQEKKENTQNKKKKNK